MWGNIRVPAEISCTDSPQTLTRSQPRIISISRGKSEGRPEGAKRPTAGDEPREFTLRGEGERVPPFFEKLPRFIFALFVNGTLMAEESFQSEVIIIPGRQPFREGFGGAGES